MQWNVGDVTAQKYQMAESKLRVNEICGKNKHSRAVTLVTTRFHTRTGAEVLRPIPANPLWNPPGRGAQGSSKLDCVTVWTLYQILSIFDQDDGEEAERSLSEEFKCDCSILSSRNGCWRVKTSLHADFHLISKKNK